MANNWRLGLDLGTASVGAVAISLDDDGKPVAVPWHAVRIFSEPNEKGQTGLTPKKAARREARQQRRQIERRARRIRKLSYLAPLIGIDPENVKPDGRRGFKLPETRANAARKRIELSDLLRVLLRIAKRRGYSGGFRGASKDDEAGVVQSGSTELARELEQLAIKRNVESVTIGEFLAERRSNGLPTRLKTGRNDISDLYALRSMLLQEFDQIWDTQAAFHPILSGSHKKKPIKEHFREAIFFQRPLRSPAGSVGKCPLERSLPRAPRAQMAAQHFRIEKTIGDLRWGAGRLATTPTPEQREIIRSCLNDPKLLTKTGELSFKKIYKALKDAGHPRPDGRSLNVDRASREHLKGNTTLKALDTLGLLDEWMGLGEKDQVSVINLLADLGSPESLDDDLWHKKFLKASARPGDKDRFRKYSDVTIGFIDKLRVQPGYDRLSKMGFEGGRMAYSVKALARLTEWLRNPWWRGPPPDDARIDEDAAIGICYPQSPKRRAKPALTAPPKTGNDTVDVALGQLHSVIRQSVSEMGSAPSEIIVEFARDLALSPKKRNEWEKLSAKNQRSRAAAREEIVAAGFPATNAAITRMLLFKEQDSHCPYCNSELSVEQALDGSQSHIEHIIPRSLTRVGRKRSELILAHASCNTQKGDRTPWMAFGHDDARWRTIEARAEQLASKKLYRKARLLLLKDYEAEVMTDKSIAEFADRQLHQTSWLARSAAMWLSDLCPNVFAARGQFTALLRNRWHLDTVIPEVRIQDGMAVLDVEGNAISPDEFAEYRKSWEGHGPSPKKILDKRLDHRHHVIDALVIALTDRSLYQALAKNYKRAVDDVQAGHSRRYEWSIEPPLRNVREVAIGIAQDCNLAHKPDRHPSGRLFQDTAHGLLKSSDGHPDRLAQRVPLTSLAENTPALTLMRIQHIASDAVRTLVQTEFERRVARGMSPAEALATPISYPGYGTEIRRVRIGRTDVFADKAVAIFHSSRTGRHCKLLIPDGYACLELSKVDSKVHAKLIPMHEAANGHGLDNQGTVRFFKGDSVIDSKDGSHLIVKQIKAAMGGQLILVPRFETRPVRLLSAKDGLRKVSGKGLTRLAVTNVRAPHSAIGGIASPPYRDRTSRDYQ